MENDNVIEMLSFYSAHGATLVKMKETGIDIDLIKQLLADYPSVNLSDVVRAIETY